MCPDWPGRKGRKRPLASVAHIEVSRAEPVSAGVGIEEAAVGLRGPGRSCHLWAPGTPSPAPSAAFVRLWQGNVSFPRPRGRGLESAPGRAAGPRPLCCPPRRPHPVDHARQGSEPACHLSKHMPGKPAPPSGARVSLPTSMCSVQTVCASGRVQVFRGICESRCA